MTDKIHYVRCSECATVYEASKQSCPDCGTPNKNLLLEEATIDENMVSEPLFNILD